MTTVAIYVSSRYVYRLKVTKRRKHGRPVGHKRVWKVRDVVTRAPA